MHLKYTCRSGLRLYGPRCPCYGRCMHIQPAVSIDVAVRHVRDGLDNFEKRIFGGYEYPDEPIATGSSAVLVRAAKNARVLRTVVDELRRGKVVALVPEMSGDEYCKQVRTQLDALIDARSTADRRNEAVLALPTSGSTGRPKLVALPVSGIERFIGWGVEHFSLDERSTSLSLSPWNFDVSLLDTWAVLAGGGSVICANPQRLHESGYLTNLLHDHDITFLQVVPSTLDVLVHAAGPHASFPFVKDVIVTGGVAGATTRRAAADLFPQARFHNVYGSTEVNDCLLHTAPAAEFASVVALPLGTPVAGCDVRVDVDGEVLRLADCPDGTEGELMVRTPWMAAGYLESGRIRPLIDPGSDQGLYRMKDRVQIAGGRMVYLGRSDRTVKLRGQRLNLDEVERLASETGVVRGACAWLSASDAGEEELHLAYTTAEGAVPGSGLQVRLALSGRLPPYAVPSRLHAFGTAFPLNGNGKPHLERIKTQAEGKRP